MDELAAIEALKALAQESRLAVFRMLVQQGPQGLPAGDIARALEIPHNTLSTHLSILVGAGLVAARRERRSIIYGLDLAGVRALLAFLVEDCCQGRPDLCAPVPMAEAALATERTR